MERTVAETMDNIRRVFQVINEQSKKVEKETGLTGPQIWAVKTISEKGSIRISELGKAMYLHPATVVGIVDRLEKRGFVVRERSSDDRRVVDVRLSSEGQALVSNSPEVASNKIIHGLESLPMDDLAMIHRGLERLVAILDAQNVPPKLIGATDVNLPEGQNS